MKKLIIILSAAAIIAGGCGNRQPKTAKDQVIGEKDTFLVQSSVIEIDKPHESNKQTNSIIVERWKTDVLIENPTIKMPDDILNMFDFSKLWMDNRTAYLGYIGNDYQRLFIEFTKIEKKNNKEYIVEGNSRVKTNKCRFNGIFKVTEIRNRKDKDYGVDNWMEGKIKEQGLVIAEFYLTEDNMHSGSGVFNGTLITNWYSDNGGKLQYDDVGVDSDSYSNNQFLGTWTSDRTGAVKQCAWGQYRIPFSGDLDIGAGEFSVNPKYIDNGWNINIDKNWLGHYELSIDYGKLNEFSSIFISYDIVIGQDSCIFSGAGYQTYFSDLCNVQEDKDELHLIYLNSIEGDDITNHSDMDTIATLIKNGQQYYIKSPIIADKNWDYNKKILLNKIKE